MRWWPLLLLLLPAGCIEPLTAPAEEAAQRLTVGESREVELRFLRFDVQGFEERVTLADLREIPRATLEEVWLLDLPLNGLVTHTLNQLASLTTAELSREPQAVANMHRLLNLTPDNAVLDGTLLEEMTEVSAVIGLPTPRVLANLLQIGITERVVPIDLAAEVLVEGLVGSHPAAQSRGGPVDAAHPDGRYPVPPGTMPITLADVVDGFRGLTERFGPAGDHPGFIVEATGFSVIEDAFAMTVKVDANALPYKGLDLGDATPANVKSIGSQIETVFPTHDPDWLRIEGLVDEPRIARLTVRVAEHDAFIRGGDARAPRPTGNSPVWGLPAWSFERMIAEMARRKAATLKAGCLSESFPTGTEAFRACLDAEGWVTFETFDNAGNPPPPAYLWDLQLELAQVRLHDGGLAEGEADVEFSLRNVALGVRAPELLDRIKANLAHDPRVLREFANAIGHGHRGAADFYYYRAAEGGPHAGDWLFFVHETDIPRTHAGRERPYAYERIGFFADEALTRKVSDATPVDGDTLHDKVRVEPGQTVYLQDDEGAVFALAVLDKPSRGRLRLRVTRVR